MNKNIAFLLLTTLFFFSCNQDFDEDNKPVYPTEETIEIGSQYSYSLRNASPSWIAKIDNESIASAAITITPSEFVHLEIVPKQLGSATITVCDTTQEIIFSCKIEVEKGFRAFQIEEIKREIEIIDETYNDLIQEYINENISFKTGNRLQLAYTTTNSGQLTIIADSDLPEKQIEGSFSIDDDNLYTFKYDSKEDFYLFDFNIDHENKVVTKTLLIKDFTNELRIKYPEAGVYKVQCILISDINSFFGKKGVIATN